MKIHESCKGWELDYSNPEMGELGEEERKILSAVLHLAGDVIGSYNNIPKDVSQEIKDMVLDSLSVIFAETKTQVVNCIEGSLSMHAITTPLSAGYTEKEIFGGTLIDLFHSTLDPTEIALAAEHYHGLQSEVPGGGEDDDGLN